MANPKIGEPIPGIKMKDNKWRSEDGWEKYQHSHKSPEGDINVHYVYNPGTGEIDDFKIKLPPGEGQ